MNYFCNENTPFRNGGRKAPAGQTAVSLKDEIVKFYNSHTKKKFISTSSFNINNYETMENITKMLEHFVGIRDIYKGYLFAENYIIDNVTNGGLDSTSSTNWKTSDGIYVSPNGLPYFAVFSGNDWEEPHISIYYYDGSKIKGYLPRVGNIVNITSRAPFESSDEINNYKHTHDGDVNFSIGTDSICLSKNLIEQDIDHRVTLF